MENPWQHHLTPPTSDHYWGKPRTSRGRGRGRATRPGRRERMEDSSSSADSDTSSDSGDFNTTSKYNNKSSSSYHRNKGPNRMISLEKNFVALDCEMVGVGPEGRFNALARVTIVDWDGNTLMDEYVKPGQEVIDYRTFVSGITPEILHDAKLCFTACKKRVIKLLRGRVLVGHGLKNDLQVLGITHPWHMTRDTATYEPFMKTRFQDGLLWPRGLKDLCREVLQRDIQVCGKPHSSYEDALSALDLYRSTQAEWEKSVAGKVQIVRAFQYEQQQQQHQYFGAMPQYVMY